MHMQTVDEKMLHPGRLEDNLRKYWKRQKDGRRNRGRKVKTLRTKRVGR